MIDIFVNYRTVDGATAAALLDTRLVARFGRERVFRDVRTLEPGRPFSRPLLNAVKECRVLLAVIGPRWLERDSQGRRRIDDSDDYVRQEIATALERDAVLLPIRVNGARQLTAEDALPPDIASIVHRQGLEIRPRHEDDDIEVLLREIARYVPPSASAPGFDPAPPSWPNQVINTGNITGSNVTFGTASPIIQTGHERRDEGRQ